MHLPCPALFPRHTHPAFVAAQGDMWTAMLRFSLLSYAPCDAIGEKGNTYIEAITQIREREQQENMPLQK